MPVFRTEKTSDYAVIAKHHLRNRNLSYKAKGLMTFMLSVPPDWDWSMAGLATLASDGVDGVRSGIRELEKYGYLSRNRIRDSSGRLGDIEYIIHEIPINTTPHFHEPNMSTRELLSKSPPIVENPNLASPTQIKPTLEIPTQDNPMQDIPRKALPMQENSTQRSNNQLSIDELSTKELNINQTNQQAECLTVQMAGGAEVSAIHTMTLVDNHLLEQQFEHFWQLYPRKAGKKAAKKAWMDINPDSHLVSTIMSAINTANQYWTNQGISQKHIPHPSTWLNEERWEDEYPTEQLPQISQHHGTGSPHTSLYHAENQGGTYNATIGTNYAIGGNDDPYREIISGK